MKGSVTMTCLQYLMGGGGSFSAGGPGTHPSRLMQVQAMPSMQHGKEERLERHHGSLWSWTQRKVAAKELHPEATRGPALSRTDLLSTTPGVAFDACVAAMGACCVGLMCNCNASQAVMYAVLCNAEHTQPAANACRKLGLIDVQC